MCFLRIRADDQAGRPRKGRLDVEHRAKLLDSTIVLAGEVEDRAAIGRDVMSDRGSTNPPSALDFDKRLVEAALEAQILAYQ